MKITFSPTGEIAEGEANQKVLAVARRARVPIRFGCGACRCGTCAVRLTKGHQGLKPMEADERELLERMGLDLSGVIRLSCQARVAADATEPELWVDLDFQDEYETIED